MATKPVANTQWATDFAALKFNPTAKHRTHGWSTSNDLTTGVPVKPTLQHQNGWQYNVHLWLNYFEEKTDELPTADSPNFTTKVTVPNGSAAVPSVGFKSDDDGSGTGFYRLAANSMGFSANGVQVGFYSSIGAWTFGALSGGSAAHLFRSSAATSLTIDSATGSNTSILLSKNNVTLWSILNLQTDNSFNIASALGTVGLVLQTGEWSLTSTSGGHAFTAPLGVYSTFQAPASGTGATGIQFIARSAGAARTSLISNDSSGNLTYFARGTQAFRVGYGVAELLAGTIDTITAWTIGAATSGGAVTHFAYGQGGAFAGTPQVAALTVSSNTDYVNTDISTYVTLSLQKKRAGEFSLTEIAVTNNTTASSANSIAEWRVRTTGGGMTRCITISGVGSTTIGVANSSAATSQFIYGNSGNFSGTPQNASLTVISNTDYNGTDITAYTAISIQKIRSAGEHAIAEIAVRNSDILASSNCISEWRVRAAGGGMQRCITINGTGNVQLPNIITTGSTISAATFDGSNNLLKVTSSERYKTDIKDIVENPIWNIRTITYRSKIPTDDQEQLNYGLSAEQIASVAPMLAIYKLIDGDLLPDGVAYDRATVLAIDAIKYLRGRIDNLYSQLGIS